MTFNNSSSYKGGEKEKSLKISKKKQRYHWPYPIEWEPTQRQLQILSIRLPRSLAKQNFPVQLLLDESATFKISDIVVSAKENYWRKIKAKGDISILANRPSGTGCECVASSPLLDGAFPQSAQRLVHIPDRPFAFRSVGHGRVDREQGVLAGSTFQINGLVKKWDSGEGDSWLGERSATIGSLDNRTAIAWVPANKATSSFSN